MSLSEQTPLLSDIVAPRMQHAPESTLVDTDFQLSSIQSKNIYGRNWVPEPPPDESRRGRTLILCFDGTGDQFDDDVSILQDNLLAVYSCFVFL